MAQSFLKLKETRSSGKALQAPCVSGSLGSHREPGSQDSPFFLVLVVGCSPTAWSQDGCFLSFWLLFGLFSNCLGGRALRFRDLFPA